MELWDVVNKVKADSGLSDRALSERLRRSSGYFSALKAQNKDPQTSTVVRMLGACGYALAAVPVDALPDDALVIDAGGGDAAGDA